MPGTPIVEMIDVSKEYLAAEASVPALRHVNFAVYPGDFILLQGPSGAGKSTLLQLAGLLDLPTQGRVLFEGDDSRRMRPAARARARLVRIGFVFQSYHLDPNLTVEENVALPALAAHRGDARPRASALLRDVGMGALARRRPSELSGGEQQRAAVARALVNDPALVLADEPTGSLDAESAAGLSAVFQTLHARGTTFLVATHDVAVFRGATAARTVHVRAGALRGAPDQRMA